MQNLDSELIKMEPDTSYCLAERITTELSRCSRNNKLCKYGLPAGSTSTYCLHPNHKYFVELHRKEQINS